MKRIYFLLLALQMMPAIYAQSKTTLDSISVLLEKIYDLDQGVRKQLGVVAQQQGSTSAAYKEMTRAMDAQDSVNQIPVATLLDKYGFMGADQLSEKASNALFLVIQHAPYEFQNRYSTLLKTAYEHKKLAPGNYAIFVDRLNVRLNKLQVFGSQIINDHLGNTYVYPIADEPGVDRRRKKAGLEPLGNYLAAAGIANYKKPAKDPLRNKIALVGHIWGPNNKALEKAQVFNNGALIATTDHNGFFKTAVATPAEKKITFTIQTQDRKLLERSYDISDKQVIDLYIFFK